MTLEMRGLIAAVAAAIFVVGVAFIAADLVKASVPPATTVADAVQSQSVVAADPGDLQAQIISGGQHFNKTCTGCHGTDGSGGGGAPNLHNEDMSDAEVYAIISDGKGPMPSFSSVYNTRQIDSLVAFIRTLK